MHGQEPIEAAGGLLWRATPEGRKLAVIHRSRHRDWSLPKGKPNPGERLEETALREVGEETGCRAVIGRPAGETRYQVNGRPKIVRYWHMEYQGDIGAPDPGEVDGVAWLTVPEALARLDHQGERDIVARASS